MRLMRVAAALGLALALVIAAPVGPAAAAPTYPTHTYPWCTVDMQEGLWTCTYVDRRQCLESALGLGAYCVENPNDMSATIVAPRPRSRSRR